MDAIYVVGNTFDGDVLGQNGDACHPPGPITGVGGLWGRADHAGRVGFLHVRANTFRRISCGLWLESKWTTVAREVEVAFNTFTDCAVTTGMPPDYPSACGAYVDCTASGAASPVRRLRVARNVFTNAWNNPTYHYGIRVEGRADTTLSFAANVFTGMKTANVLINPRRPLWPVRSWVKQITDPVRRTWTTRFR